MLPKSLQRLRPWPRTPHRSRGRPGTRRSRPGMPCSADAWAHLRNGDRSPRECCSRGERDSGDRVVQRPNKPWSLTAPDPLPFPTSRPEATGSPSRQRVLRTGQVQILPCPRDNTTTCRRFPESCDGEHQCRSRLHPLSRGRRANQRAGAATDPRGLSQLLHQLRLARGSYDPRAEVSTRCTNVN